MTAANRAENDPLDPDFFTLLTGSFARIVGWPLITAGQGPEWLYETAPFAVVAHDTELDPRFIYANRAAQACFEYSLGEFTGLPSRLSAEPVERAERQRLLEKVARDGFVADYRGVRIAKSGRRFWIEGGIIWQLVDGHGVRHGQAATFASWKDL